MPECRSPRRQACRFRHLRNLATDSTISAVGNGKFAFTADVTGLQTLNQTFRSPLLHTGAGTRSRRRLRASIQAISQIRRSSSTTTRPTILPAPGSRLRCATGNGSSTQSRYLANGHCSDAFLPVCTPGNGALLAATAMLLGGGVGRRRGGQPLPGVPRDGTWTVKARLRIRLSVQYRRRALPRRSVGRARV